MKQSTLNSEFTLKGKGLHTGNEVILTCKPAPVNFGYQFKRIDVKYKPHIPALADYVIQSERNTILEKDSVCVQTPEHLLSALYGSGIDNCLIELNAEEVPILDGSAKFFVKAIEKVGKKTQNADRKYFTVNKPYHYKNNDDAEISLLPDKDFKVDVHIAFDTPFLQNQFASLYSLNDYKNEISSCRTFVFFKDLEPLFEKDLIKGGEFENALVFLDKTVPKEEYDRVARLFNQKWEMIKEPGLINNTTLQFNNEPARHKLLDVMGDIALCGVFFKGRIVANKPSHALNTAFAKTIRREIKDMNKKPPPIDVNAKPVMDINQIKNILPHRTPFLLVDKILELTDQHIVGIKNVTFNEPFFAGHFPDEPVMPGVLIAEAIAQCGGILTLKGVQDPKKYSTYFVKIDNLKFRRKVIPGDTLIFKIEFSAKPRRNMIQMRAKAFVGDSLVTDGEFMAQVIKNK